MTCSAMTIFMEKAGASDAAAAQATPPRTGRAVRRAMSSRLDAAGPVTVISKTQVATGDRGCLRQGENKVWLNGNVTLSDSGNVTKGDKLTYDLATGQATVENTGAAGRVKGCSSLARRTGGDDKSGASK